MNERSLKSFWIGLSALAGLMLLAVVVMLCLRPKRIPSESLVLPDGWEPHIVAVTYGVNHVVGTPLAKLAARLPPAGRTALARVFGPRLTTCSTLSLSTPSLVVWLEGAAKGPSAPAAVAPGPPPAFRGHWRGALGIPQTYALLSDTAGFLSGESSPLAGGWRVLSRGGRAVRQEQLVFTVFPRRDQKLAVHFFHYEPTRGVAHCGSLRFANPLHGTFPQWRPEPLPAGRRVGDVQIILRGFGTGYETESSFWLSHDLGTPSGFGTNRIDGRNVCVFSLGVQPLADTNQVWRVDKVELSDATGNHARAMQMGWRSGPDGDFNLFEPGLWPGEAVWKLRCELKAAGALAPVENIVFSNVPLGSPRASNSLGCVTNLSGLSVTLDDLSRTGPRGGAPANFRGPGVAHLTLRGLTNEVSLDLVSASVHNGPNHVLGFVDGSGPRRVCRFIGIPSQAKWMDIKFAVRPSCWVEFMVKPGVGSAWWDAPGRSARQAGVQK